MTRKALFPSSERYTLSHAEHTIRLPESLAFRNKQLPRVSRIELEHIEMMGNHEPRPNIMRKLCGLASIQIPRNP